MITVVAALIERGGRILICRRRADQDHPGKWEFPGGKSERGEAPEASLRRELREELGISARIDREIARYRYQYPGKPEIELIFFRVVAFDGDPHYDHFDEARWVSPRDMPLFDFLEGDVEFVRALARGELSGSIDH